MSDASDGADIDDIREQKREELAKRAGSPDEPLHVEGRDHLDDILDSHGVVLLDFHADWCGPCKMLEPIVESIAGDMAVTVAKVDVDAHQDIASEYQIQGVPTLFLFVDGEPTERMVGLQEETELRSLLERHL